MVRVFVLKEFESISRPGNSRTYVTGFGTDALPISNLVSDSDSAVLS